MKSSNRLIAAMLIVALLAGGFWILILSPKREEANDLSAEVEQLQSTLAVTESQVAEAEAARRQFPADYSKMVTLGTAVPSGEETASLLISLNDIASGTKISFDSIKLSEGSGGGEAEAAASAPQAGPSQPVTSTVPPTEAAAALQPLGSLVGPDGLLTMPYSLSFRGDFFDVADFIGGLDSLVKTKPHKTEVDGRLITIDGFVLTEDPEKKFPALKADFAVTTYLAPPGQGTTAGATATAPAGEIPSAAGAETTTGTPSSFSTNPAQ